MIDYEELLESLAIKIEDQLNMIRRNRIEYAVDIEEELQEMLDEINNALGIEV